MICCLLNENVSGYGGSCDILIASESNSMYRCILGKFWIWEYSLSNDCWISAFHLWVLNKTAMSIRYNVLWFINSIEYL